MKFLTAFFLILTSVACATGHCGKEQSKLSPHLTATKDSMTKEPSEVPIDESHVLVYKYDDSKQCENEKSISLEKMQKELEGIEVLSSKKKNDGLIHISVCGGVTGNANVYEIKKPDLEKALSRGFKLWRFK